MRSIVATTILFAGILAMIFSGATTSAQGQVFLTNEMPNPYQQIQDQQIDPRFMSFEQFLQYMFYYKEMFGQDYVTKIYKEYHNDDDDDDDDDDKKKHRDKDWWKHNSKDKDWWKEHNDKKKYCEGKGEWNGKKCVTDNEEDKTAWEDAVCDDGNKKSKFCGNADKDSNKDEEEREIKKLVEEIDEEEQQEQEESKQQDDDDDEQDEEPEQESESNDEEEDDSDEDDDSGGEDDSDGEDDGGSEEEG